MKALCVSVIVTLIAAGCGSDVSGNAPPVFRGTLQLATSEDTAGTVTIDAYDPDGLTVTLEIATAPQHGTASLSGTVVTYAPAANFNGADSIGVTVSDGVLSTAGSITVQVAAVNDPPVGTPDAYATQEDVPLVVTTQALLANDTDVDGDPLTVTGLGAPTGGTVSLSGGSVTFTPFPNSSGAAAFQYTLSDGKVHVDVPVQVTVGAVNDPPVAIDDAATTAEDTPAVISVATLTANDTDADGPTPMVTAVSNATNGTAALAGGFVTFTPTRDFAGTAGFDYTASDGSATDTAHVTVTVTPVEDPPVAVDDLATTPLGTPVMIAAATLLANDTDPDQGATQSLTVVQNPQHGLRVLVRERVDTRLERLRRSEQRCHVLEDDARLGPVRYVSDVAVEIHGSSSCTPSCRPTAYLESRRSALQAAGPLRQDCHLVHRADHHEALAGPKGRRRPRVRVDGTVRIDDGDDLRARRLSNARLTQRAPDVAGVAGKLDLLQPKLHTVGAGDQIQVVRDGRLQDDRGHPATADHVGRDYTVCSRGHELGLGRLV